MDDRYGAKMLSEGLIAEALCAGQAQGFRGEEKSAFAKSPIDGPVAILREGLAGDVQADREHHGGPDMAVHLYPLDHHAFWRQQLGGHGMLDQPGAFGSNLAVAGIDETQVRIGDRFRLGSALLEISQPRKPCWKIEHRFGRKGMVAKILKTGRCGWYFRVIEQGEAQAGDRMECVERSVEEWSVRRVFNLLWGDPKVATIDELEALAALASLTPKLQGTLRDRLS